MKWRRYTEEHICAIVNTCGTDGNISFCGGPAGAVTSGSREELPLAEERGAGAAQAAAAQESDLLTSSREVDVDVDELELCPEYQLREKLEAWKVEEYGAVFERLPPVLVGKVDGHLYLLDGWHRVAAARRVGREKVAALIIETDAATAFSLAIRGNAMHGLPLRTKEKKAAARGMLVRFPE